MGWSDAIEATRLRFRPQVITTLFVGESAPISGDFFYDGNNAMLRYMKLAIFGTDHQGDAEFLTAFKSLGWYLDDLVLTPVNQLSGATRKQSLLGAQAGLALRIAEYKPLAIVSLLKSIAPVVEAAAEAAGSIAPCYSTPFPGMGQQSKFRLAMADIVPRLPRLEVG